MAIRSVYVSDPAFEDDLIRVGGDEHRHLVVARAGKGEPVEIFDGKGNVWKGTIVALGKRETLARVKENHRAERNGAEVILAQALIRHSAFELALEKAVEIGVSRIVPFTASRSNVNAAGRQDRWFRIVIEAAKQSKRYYLPVLSVPVTFEDVLCFDAKSKILFAEHGGGPLKSSLFGEPVLYAVGPEGGWTDQELGLARKRGFGLVSLGGGILKAETAAIVGAALIRYELGF